RRRVELSTPREKSSGALKKRLNSATLQMPSISGISARDNILVLPRIFTREIIWAPSGKCSPAAAPSLLAMTTIPTDAQLPSSEQLPQTSTSLASIAIPKATSIWLHFGHMIPTSAGGSTVIRLVKGEDST